MLQNRKRVGAKEKAVLLEHNAPRIPQEEINQEVFSSLVIAGLFPIRSFLQVKPDCTLVSSELRSAAIAW